MDTRPGNGRCDNLVCTVGVYLNFIGELAVTWTWESGGGDAAGGFLFRFIGSGTRRRSSRFPEGTLPSDQYRSSSSVAQVFSLPAPVSIPLPPSLPLYLSLSLHLLLSLLGRFQYLSKFSEPAMNKLFSDFEYLSVLRGNGTAIEGPTTERTEMGDID